jgi:hypothetical protein
MIYLIIGFSIMMMLLFLAGLVWFLGVMLGRVLPEAAKSRNYFEFLFLTVYLPAGWFLSCVLVRIIQHMMKG